MLASGALFASGVLSVPDVAGAGWVRGLVASWWWVVTRNEFVVLARSPCLLHGRRSLFLPVSPRLCRLSASTTVHSGSGTLERVSIPAGMDNTGGGPSIPDAGKRMDRLGVTIF